MANGRYFRIHLRLDVEISRGEDHLSKMVCLAWFAIVRKSETTFLCLRLFLQKDLSSNLKFAKTFLACIIWLKLFERFLNRD
jgi:hypothetical protein